MHPAGGGFGIVDELGACQSLDNCFVPHTLPAFSSLCFTPDMKVNTITSWLTGKTR